MRHTALPLMFCMGLLSGCDRPPSTVPPATQAAYSPGEYSAFLAQTGLDIPPGVEVVSYSSGWDERFLMLRMPRSDVKDFVARLPVQPAAGKPRMDGMAGKEDRPSWWRPDEIKASQYFEGQMTWKTRALGMVRVQVEDADPARVLVWVMKS